MKYAHVSASTENRPTLFSTLLLVIVLFGCAALLIARPHSASSQSGTILMSGYVWSDTIGWISLSGSGYGISIASNGTMSGYAWSENIGWISANSADLVGCPSGACTAQDVNGVFSGWLRAIAGGTASSGGWDGFISLAGTGYGVVETSGALSGYAWGSTNVGWIDFSGTTPFGPACVLTPSSPSIVQGNTATISWTSSRSTSGTISPVVAGASPIPGGSVAAGSAGVQPNVTTTYTGTFTGPGGSSQCNATITVTCAPIYSCAGSTITYTDATCATNNVATCSSPSFCSAGQSTCQWPAATSTPSGTRTGHLQAQPAIIHPGDTTRLYWNVTNATSCTVTGNSQSWPSSGNGLSSGSSGVLTNTMSNKTTFTLNCAAYQGNTNLVETFDVLVQPKFKEQ